MIVVKHQIKQSAVNLCDVLVPTVHRSVPWDIGHKVDGELNAKLTILGHIQSFLHASHVQIFPTKFHKSMLRHKASTERIFQLHNFSVASLLTS